MTTTTAQQRITPAPARRTRARALVIATATLAALVVWIVAVPLLGTDLLVRSGSDSAQRVGPGAVVVTSLIASLLGWVLLAVLERRTSRAHTVWTGAAVVVLVLSLGGPLTAATTTAAKTALALMHLAVGAVLIHGVRRSSRTA